MADRTFKLDIVTPDRVVLSEHVISLRAPGVLGSFGILPHHAPLLSELAIGELRYRRENGQEVRLAVGGGFLQVFSNQVTVLADSAERVDEIDVERARASLDRARQAQRELVGAFTTDAVTQAQAAVERAQNRIRVASG